MQIDVKPQGLLGKISRSAVKPGVPFEGDRLYLLLLIGVTIITSLILFKDFVFGNRLLIFTDIGSDTYYSYYRFYYFLTENIQNLELPFWSFQMGMGTNVITLYQFLYDPFSLIYYVVGSDNISSAIVYTFILKAALSSWFAFIFFRYIGISVIPTVVCSFLFAFNGYSMLWGQHYFFGSSVVFLPLLLYALEKWLSEGKWLLLLCVLALLVLNIYNFYQMFFLVFIYYIFRFYVKFEFNMKLFLDLTSRLVIILFLSIGLVAVFVLPEYYLLTNSPRISGVSLLSLFQGMLNLNTADYYFSAFCRLFSNNLQGIGSNYIGFLNYYESIQLYTGLLFLLMIPQAYCVFDRRQKTIASAGIMVALLFIGFPIFAQVMNGFQYPTYRWGFDVIFAEVLLLAYLLHAVIQSGRVNHAVLLVTLLVLVSYLFLINYDYANNHDVYNYNIKKIFYSGLFLSIYAILVSYISKNGVQRKAAFLLLLMVLPIEMVSEHRDTFTQRSTLEKGIESNNQVDLFGSTHEVVDYLKSVDNSFYRIDKNRWILSLNDSLVQGYNGFDAYNSLNTPSYYKFLHDMEIPLTKGVPVAVTILGWTSLQRPYLADLLSAKYYLTKDSTVTLGNVRFIKKIGNIFLYERLDALPFGFTYDSYISREKFFSTENGDKRDSLLLRGFLPPDFGGETIFNKLSEASYKDRDGKELRENLVYNTLNINQFSDDFIEGNIALEKDKLLFLSIPYDIGWRATVNGEKLKIYKVNAGFSGILLSKGNNYLQLEFYPPYFKQGFLISICCFLIILYLIFYRLKVLGVLTANRLHSG